MIIHIAFALTINIINPEVTLYALSRLLYFADLLYVGNMTANEGGPRYSILVCVHLSAFIFSCCFWMQHAVFSVSTLLDVRGIVEIN